MFEELLSDQNPHWRGSFYEEGIHRDVLGKVIQYIDIPHIVSIVGVRRCGKSTLLRQTINYLIKERGIAPQQILFINLETPALGSYRHDITYLERLHSDYLKLIQPQGQIFFFLDEAQFFPEWQVFVKAHYEQKKIKFFITGSNSRLLSSEYITLLSGRTLPVEIFPFSFAEFIRVGGMDDQDKIGLTADRHRLRSLLEEYLHFGGFPEIAYVQESAVKKEILSMYGRHILFQDIAPRFNVKKSSDLENLYYYIITNVSSLYTYNSLAKATGLNDKTVKDYMMFFADARLLMSVDLHDYSVKQRLKSPRKVYSIDTGIAATGSLSYSKNIGRLLENLVFLELMRRGFDIFYYRTKNNLEVDFLCRRERQITALVQTSLEMQADKTRKREIRALEKAMEETGLQESTIVTLEEEGEETVTSGRIAIVPAYKYLLGK
jgi:predicted AAA+ superfamily ATPase